MIQDRLEGLLLMSVERKTVMSLSVDTICVQLSLELSQALLP